MSGGVGPTCGDISLPKEEEQHRQATTDHDRPLQPNNTSRSFLTFRQLNALAVIVIFSASGMVSIEDLAFVLFSFLYIYFLSTFAFPSLIPSSPDPPVFRSNTRFLNLYVSIGALIGLLLPILYIFHGFLEGDKQGIKAAAPHVFLLASQVFMEGVTFSRRFSIPVRVFVPVFYNTKRVFTIVEWLRSEVEKEEPGGSERRVYVGRALAVANLVFWCFNLFGFLLPVYLPKAFKIYYGGHKVKA